MVNVFCQPSCGRHVVGMIFIEEGNQDVDIQ